MEGTQGLDTLEGAAAWRKGLEALAGFQPLVKAIYNAPEPEATTLKKRARAAGLDQNK